MVPCPEAFVFHTPEQENVIKGMTVHTAILNRAHPVRKSGVGVNLLRRDQGESLEATVLIKHRPANFT